jgi:hypothetical protein
VYKKRLAAQIDSLLQEVKGGEWMPTSLLAPAVLKQLLETVRDLNKKLAEVNAPQLKKPVALLNYYTSKAYQVRNQNQALMVLNVAKALKYASQIIETVYRNKGLKGE